MKQQDRATQTKESILEAAEYLFAVQGYEATSVSMICDAVGVSKGAFYHHYKTKQSVFLELMQRWLKGLDEQLVLISESSNNVKDGLLSMGKIVGQVLDVGGPQLPIFLEFLSRAIRDPAIWDATVEPFQRCSPRHNCSGGWNARSGSSGPRWRGLAGRNPGSAATPASWNSCEVGK
jgi:AcrR family transcriptional regulator